MSRIHMLTSKIIGQEGKDNILKYIKKSFVKALAMEQSDFEKMAANFTNN